MKEILTRTLTGGVFVISVIGSMFWHPLAFFLMMGIYMTIGLDEFFKLVLPQKKRNWFYLATGVLLYAVVALVLLSYLDNKFILLVLPIFSLIIVFELFKKNGSWKNISSYLLSYVYVALPFAVLNAFFYISDSRLNILLPISIFTLVWINDIFAYLTGTFFGKHKLLERISPKKTWEGAIGGFVFALASAFIFFRLSDLFSLQIWLVYAFILVISGTLGDLAESMLKRNMGVKDSGSIFPGHGGVLDRFDAVLFAAPFAFVFLIFVL